MSLDLAFVRSQFPALADGFAYFDNAHEPIEPDPYLEGYDWAEGLS